jgi:hypothetical protein
MRERVSGLFSWPAEMFHEASQYVMSSDLTAISIRNSASDKIK